MLALPHHNLHVISLMCGQRVQHTIASLLEPACTHISQTCLLDYAEAEIKKFERVANTIRKVNDGIIANHSAATADFIDVEFSNNTGRARRAWSSRSTWEKERLKQACSQAARIMEERSVLYLSPTLARVIILTKVDTCPQSPPFQERRQDFKRGKRKKIET